MAGAFLGMKAMKFSKWSKDVAGERLVEEEAAAASIEQKRQERVVLISLGRGNRNRCFFKDEAGSTIQCYTVDHRKLRRTELKT